MCENAENPAPFRRIYETARSFTRPSGSDPEAVFLFAYPIHVSQNLRDSLEQLRRNEIADIGQAEK